MCVLVKQSVKAFMIAKRNIPIYTMKAIESDDSISSVCHYYKWELGKEFIASGSKTSGLKIRGVYKITEGFFHTSARATNLVKSLNNGEWDNMLDHYNQKAIIVKGYIPRGTLYSKGINTRCASSLNGKNAYISRSLVLTEIVLIQGKRRKLITFRAKSLK